MPRPFLFLFPVIVIVIGQYIIFERVRDFGFGPDGVIRADRDAQHPSVAYPRNMLRISSVENHVEECDRRAEGIAREPFGIVFVCVSAIDGLSIESRQYRCESKQFNSKAKCRRCHSNCYACTIPHAYPSGLLRSAPRRAFAKRFAGASRSRCRQHVRRL